MIAIVTALREELAPLLRRAKIERVVRVGRHRCHVGTLMDTPVVLMAGGDGVARAEAAVSELLRRFDVSLLLGAGIAGGIVTSLRSGDLAVASTVRGPDGLEIDCDPLLVDRLAALDVRLQRVTIRSIARMAGSLSEKRELAASTPRAHVIDTESSGWAAAASTSGIPFVVVRAIFDGAEDEVPAYVAASTAADGSIDRAAVVRHAVLHPNAISGLLQMRSRLQTCCDTLGAFVVRAVAGLEPGSIEAADESRLNELLVETSRTFALCIPLLPEATRRQVTIAYLLFRIADTFEDASHWPVSDRIAALDAFCRLLRNPEAGEAGRLSAAWVAAGPSPHAGYMKLMADVPLVIKALTLLPAPAHAVIRDHVIRSAQGMAQFVALTDHSALQLADMAQLNAYCYAVAGIVGEMLTELFLIRAPQLVARAPFLRARAAAFGEGLQLVNILKDATSDASEGRTYIPPGADRATIFALARTGLESAAEYTAALQSGGAPEGVVAFAALPVALAQATLDRMEASGAKKIGRSEVLRIMRHVNQSVARSESPLRGRSQIPSGFARMRAILSVRFGNGSWPAR